MLLAELGELVVGKFEYGTQPCEPSLEFARYLVVRLIGEPMIERLPKRAASPFGFALPPFCPGMPSTQRGHAERRSSIARNGRRCNQTRRSPKLESWRRCYPSRCRTHFPGAGRLR